MNKFLVSHIKPHWTRGWRAALILTLLGGVLAEAAESKAPSAPVVLLRDPGFQLGFKVWSPKPGKHVECGRLRPNPTAATEPIWGLAQWSSKFPLSDPQPIRMSSGALCFSNEAKAVTFGPPGTAEADLWLAIHSGREYGERLRQKGEPWPHLLIEQRVDNSPPLIQIAQLHFHLEYRLHHVEAFQKEAAHPNLHAAQLLAYLSVQNLNKQSAGYGDYLWFGIPLYDSRNRESKTYAAMDTGTKKFIYTPAVTNYTTVSAHSGAWVTIDRDLLTLIRQGLNTAWGQDFLKNSRDLNDFRIGGFNLGWEMPGSFNVEAQIRNLALEAK